MRQYLAELKFRTSGEGFIDITSLINQAIVDHGFIAGLATVHVKHTSCSLTINENADPRVLDDLAAYLKALVPQEGVRPISGLGSLRPYSHDDEGADDMPAHIRTALTTTTLSVTIDRSRLSLGTWQAVYLWEHRCLGQLRTVGLHLIGE